MSVSHTIFISPGRPVERLISDIGSACGTLLHVTTPGRIDYSASLGRAAVEVELSHDYEDDHGIRFEDYDALITVRDFDSNIQRQEQIATDVFRNLAHLDTYCMVLVRDFQRLLDSAVAPRSC
ncbi:hypothetical protein [Streptomyces sp. NPDC048669]|uniref:hypothetical protein n=1 Tax=Streptomyces sp. NPDC048669 TaxID=3155267 RepID=UPI00341BC2D0